MKDELITFETAKLAKEKGFDADCLHFYCVNSTCNYIEKPNKYSFEVNANTPNETNFGYGKTWSAPTQSLLQRWLREKHDLNIILNYTRITSSSPHEWSFKIERTSNVYGERIIGVPFTPLIDNTYELALEAGLQHALKLIKQ